MIKPNDIVNTICSPVNQSVHTQPTTRDRKAYFASYRRKERLAKGTPERQLLSRTKAILKGNLREYGPRLAAVLTKFEGELKGRLS